MGAVLRAARQRRGLTLEQVASSTKLSSSVLRSIEGNAWDHLPGGLLTRGHLRAYARAVEVSPEDVVEAYVAQLPPPPVETPPPRTSAIPRPPSLARWLMAAVAILAGVAVYDRQRSRLEAPSTPASDSARILSAEEPPTPKAASETALTTSPDAPSGLSVAIDATGPCWVSVQADGEQVVYRLFTAGETVTVTAAEQLVLRIGDAATFSYTLNGLPGRSLGTAGQPVSVTITRDNVQTYVSSPEAALQLHDRRPAET